MRFLVTIPADKNSEAGKMPSPEIIERMVKFNVESFKAGVMLAAEGLYPSSYGARLRYDAPGKMTVTDGPFTEAKELIGGFWIIQARSKDEAIAWMKKAPVGGGVELQLRPLVDFDHETGQTGEAQP